MKITVTKYKWNIIKSDEGYMLQKPEVVESKDQTFETKQECWAEWTSLSVPGGMKYAGYTDDEKSITIEYIGIEGGQKFVLEKWEGFDKDIVKHYGIKQILFSKMEDVNNPFPSIKQTNEMWFTDEKSWKEQVEKLEPDFDWSEDPLVPFVYGRYTSKHGVTATIVYNYETGNGTTGN